MTETVTPAHKQVFLPIDDSSVIIRQNGTFTPHQVYRYRRHAYVRTGQGYVRLRPHGHVSKTGLYWDALSIPGHETEVTGVDLFVLPFGQRAAA